MMTPRFDPGLPKHSKPQKRESRVKPIFYSATRAELDVHAHGFKRAGKALVAATMPSCNQLFLEAY